MENQSGASLALDLMVTFATEMLIPLMLVMFVGGIAMRMLTFYTVKREEWFAREFEKRVTEFLDKGDIPISASFYVMTKRLLEKTFYELFEVRFYMKRRKPDFIMTVSDRVFLIKQGAAWFVHDILKRVKNLRHNHTHHPRLFEISKKTLAHNPCFTKVFGLFSASGVNSILNILPGVFIVMGVFGTFLGIMKGLPELGGMDLTDIEGTKNTMDTFLLKISFAMSTSLVGIIVSVLMSFLNAAFAPEKAFVAAVDRLENGLESLWQVSTDNNIPSDLEKFDENKHPEEVLAEQAVNKELASKERRKVS